MILSGTYDYGLVALSVLVAILASYAALMLTARVTASKGPIRRAWLVCGSTAMGVGVWSMHYIGMLAFKLPVPVLYHWPTVLISLLAAVFASSVALFVASRRALAIRAVVLGSVLMGGGVSAMHYIGMAAMRMPAMCEWSWPTVGVSVGLAIVISSVAIWLAFSLRAGTPQQPWRRPASAVLMGVSIATMHYTGMAAARFMRGEWPPDIAHSVGISSLGIAGLTVAVLVILGATIGTAVLDRKFSDETSKLEDSEQLFRDLLDSAQIILWQMDINSGRFTLVTRQAEEILSIPAEDWLADENFWKNHIHPDDLALTLGEFAYAIESNSAQTFEHRMRSADGSYQWLRTSVRLVRRAGRQFLSGVMLDVTARMMIEAALHEERGLFDALMDTIPDHIYFKDLNSCFLRVNEAQSAHLKALNPLSMIGLSDADFFDEAHARKALADEREIIRSGKPLLNVEEDEFSQDGREQWVTTSKLPLRNVNGEIVGTFGVSRDITQRKLAEKELLKRSQELEQANEKLRQEMEERKLLESQLLQAQKLEAIGQLAAGVAHEINTPIQYVGDNCQFLVDSFRQLNAMLCQYDKALGALRTSGCQPELVSETEECLARSDLAYLSSEIPLAIEQSLEGVERVARIVRAMKEFSHPGSGQKEAMDLNHAIENTLIVCRNEWKYVAEAVTDLDTALPPVHCLPGEMNQVLLNLVVNAAHAIDHAKRERGAGKIVVSTKLDGKVAEVRVADNGTGIPAAIQARIFDPFFTTKEVGRGTGQGLTLARNIVVKKHGGTLTFETEENQGTTFIARIPINSIDLETDRDAIGQEEQLLVGSAVSSHGFTEEV